MANKDFDKIFRDKLYGHHTPVDEGMWSSIEAGLDGTRTTPVGWWSKWRKVAGYAAAAVAVIVATLLFTLENQTHQPIKTIDAGLPKLVAQSASAQPAQAQAPVLQPEKTESAGATETATSVATAATATKTAATATKTVSTATAATAATATATVSTATSTTTSTATSTASETSVASASPTASGKSAVLSSDQGQMEEQTALQIIPEEVVAFSKSSFSLFTNVAPRNDITASSNHFGVMASSGISHSNRELQSMEIISQAEHSLPLNLGVQVQFELGEKISAGVGLSYTLLKSRYEALVNKKYHNVKQSLHYIGVPVNLYFSLMQSSKFKFYANVGGAVEKGVKASYRLTSYDGSSLSAKADIEGFQYSANFGLGLEYRFSKPCGIYLEPNAVYFFDSKVPASVRTDQPFQLKAEVGFRFHL